jgi:hypothetical protein
LPLTGTTVCMYAQFTSTVTYVEYILQPLG